MHAKEHEQSLQESNEITSGNHNENIESTSIIELLQLQKKITKEIAKNEKRFNQIKQQWQKESQPMEQDKVNFLFLFLNNIYCTDTSIRK